MSRGILVMCLFGLVKGGEMLHKNVLDPTHLTSKKKTELSRVQDCDTYESTDITERGASQISLQSQLI